MRDRQGGVLWSRLEEADSGLTWAWGQVVDPYDPGSSLPADIWGDGSADKVPAELELPADPQFGDIWSAARDNDVPAPGQPRRPALAPAPVPHGRRGGLRRALRVLGAAPQVLALALVVVASAGLLLALAAGRPDGPSFDVSQQADAAGLQPTSSMPTATVPRAPSTTLTTLATSSPPSPIGGEAPPTTSVSRPAPATAATTPVTIAAPRSPARSETTPTPVESPQDPQPSPAPPPTPTVSTPPPTTIVLLPQDTTVTTRRLRPTTPDTTVAPSTTVPASDDLPVEED